MLSLYLQCWWPYESTGLSIIALPFMNVSGKAVNDGPCTCLATHMEDPEVVQAPGFNLAQQLPVQPFGE